MTEIDAGMRIGELGARVGLSTHALRAWEQRYGLLRPVRTAHGYRIYGPEDERRVRAVLALRAQGMHPAQAAARVLAEEHLEAVAQESAADHAASARAPEAFIDAMFVSLQTFDESAADFAIDALLRRMSLADAVDDAILPFLEQLGNRWEAGTTSIAQEHFVSGLLRRRFAPLTLTRGTAGPLVVLAAPSGEFHDLPLILFAGLLSRAGWRVRQLGANTPVGELAAVAGDADVVVVAATGEHFLTAEGPALRRLAAGVPVFIAGRGATPRLAKRLGVTQLPNRLGEALTIVTSVVAHRKDPS